LTFPELPFRTGVDFALFNVGLSVFMGAEADRKVGFRFCLAPANGGCLGVVPFPFDLKEDGGDRTPSDVIAAMAFPVSL